MAEQIVREIWLFQKRRVPPIDIVAGSQIPIALEMKDYTIPSGATVKVYARPWGRETTYVQDATATGNTVVFTPQDGFFREGWNSVQLEINGSKIPLALDVNGGVRLSDGGSGATPEAVRPLVARAEQAAAKAAEEAEKAITPLVSKAQEAEKNAAAQAAAAKGSADAAATSAQQIADSAEKIQEEVRQLKEDISYDEKQLLSKTSNLLNWKNAEIFYGYNDGSKLVASPNNDFHTVIVPVSVPYRTSFFITRFGQLSSRFSVATIREKAVSGTITYNTQQSNTAKSIQISARPEDEYLAIWFAGANDSDWKSYLKNITVTKGIFAPDYYIEPVENNAVNKVIKIYEENELNRTTNLFNCNNPMLFYGMNTGSILKYGNQCCILIPVNESSLKAYTVSRFGEKGKYFSVATLHDEPGDGVTTYNTTQDNNAESIQIYVRPDDKYIVVWFYTNSDTVKMKDIMDGIVVLRRYIPATGFIPYFKKNNPLFGKKINFLGDSFTDDAISYEYQLTDRMCLDNIHVGKGNSAIVTDTNSADSFLTRMSALDENADITIIFGGINDARDIGNGSIILGEIDSAHDKTSFYGGMQLLLDNIIAKIPAQFILGVIPPSFQPNKPYTTWIPQIQKAEREIYNKYHIHFVDLDKDCFAMSDNPTIMALYRKSVTGTTNYHPNSAGAKKIADCVQGELEKYIH